MTKEQILALITEKIAGQGNQVDTGGALPAILEGIIELIPEPTPPTPPTPAEVLDAVTITSQKNYADISIVAIAGLSKGAACEALGISSAALDALMAGDILRIKFADYILSLSNAKADGSKVQLVASINASQIDMEETTLVNGLQIDFDSAEGTYDIDRIV